MQGLLILAFFVIVTISHASFLLFAKSNQRQYYAYKKRLWQTHFVFNNLLWTALLVWITALQFVTPHIMFPFWLKLVGIVILIVGFLLARAGFAALGLSQAMGYRFFFPERVKRVQKGVYRYLKNPIYDGFILAFLGLGLVLGIVVDFYLALVSFVLLNILLATVENYEYPRSLGDLF